MTIAWSSPAIARIVDFIRSRTGLVFSEPRRAEVEGTIRRAMARRGIAVVDRFVDVLADDTETRESLIAELTIGETYFRRDGAQIDLLRRRVLPQLLAETDRRLRVWSAGCASGEEPYSILMLLDEIEALDRAEVVGTDISRPRLEDAQRGIYSRWSLRGMSDRLVERYFIQRGRYFELSPHLRSHAEFRYLNLAEDSYPSLSTGIWGMDLILCRNVLIYFDRATVARVARQLLDSLSDTGWLLLGASDPPIGELVECDVVVTEAGLVYRRIAAGEAGVVTRPHAAPWLPPAEFAAPPAAETVFTPVAQDDAGAATSAGETGAEPFGSAVAARAEGEGDGMDLLAREWAAAVDTAADAAPAAAVERSETAEEVLLRAWGHRDYDVVREQASGLAAEGGLSEAAWIAWLRALANQGALADAGTLVVRALAEHPTSAELLYIDAVLQLHANRARDAVAAARRALYLDRTLVVAHLALADALQRLGDVTGAKRSLRNAAAQLDDVANDAVVPASDGETAGRLTELVRVQLRLLETARTQEA